MKPNAYSDLSEQTWPMSRHRLGEVLRDRIEWYPEKVMFGTDLFPGAGEFDWEEIGWQTSEIVRTVLRGNTLKFYGWPDRP